MLLPRFIWHAAFHGKYARGVVERLGFISNFDPTGRPVVWIHCVSVGEANAARPLVDRIHRERPDLSIVISTTTATGQKVARDVFTGVSDLVFYFPFDWRSTVNRALKRIRPVAVVLVETEIWFNFLRETSKAHARIAIVNGRLSERSFLRFRYISQFMRRVLSHVDLALMQDKSDATRIMSLGLHGTKVKVTGNIKFDAAIAADEGELTEKFRSRFAIAGDSTLMIAASTHRPEEKWILESFKSIWRDSGEPLPRLMIAPRHPERFQEVADLIEASGLTWVRRSDADSGRDHNADVILLDSIGELRSVYPLAKAVFVGGSLIPHGGQSVFEPAAAGRAIITGPYTANFDAVVVELNDKDAIVQLRGGSKDAVVSELTSAIRDLLWDEKRRNELAANALAVIENNRGAVSRTYEYLQQILPDRTVNK